MINKITINAFRNTFFKSNLLMKKNLKKILPEANVCSDRAEKAVLIENAKFQIS